nr:extensin-like [Penaeus vannamei]
MKVLAIVIWAAAATSWAAPEDGYSYQAPVPIPQSPQYPPTPAQYQFQWDVNDRHSGNYFGQHEQRNGDRTLGSYYVQLPDTRFMRVEYLADSEGFQPTVSIVGDAQYPDAPSKMYSQPAPAPTQVYSEPMPAPAEEYSEPMPVPAEEYTQPDPAPAQTYSELDLARQYTQPDSVPEEVYTPPILSQSSQQYSQPTLVPTQQYAQPSLAPSQQYGQPALATSQQSGQPSPAPSQQYTEPTPAPAPTQQYSQPSSSPAPTQQYSQPGPALTLLPAGEYSLPASALSPLSPEHVSGIYRARVNKITVRTVSF